MGFFYVTERESASETGIRAAGAIARVGYLARIAEWERLTTARTPKGLEIAALLLFMESNVGRDIEDDDMDFWEALGKETGFIVRSEPLDPPHDSEEGLNPIWAVPGLGGQARALLREKTKLMILTRDNGGGLANPQGEPIEDVTLDEFRSIWKYGFLLRSFEEFFWDSYEPEPFNPDRV